jgi:N-acetylmuramic acid 6-phosphate etherase
MTLRAAIDTAMQNIDPTITSQEYHFESAWLGIAGMDRPGLREGLAARIPSVMDVSNLRLTNDVDLLAATMSRYPTIRSAIVLIAGTGSVAMRYTVQPESSEPTRVARSGGWGHLLGDEGGGYAIGRQAIRHTLRAVEDKRLGLQQETLGTLEQAILDQFGLSSTENPDLLSAVLLGDQGQPAKAKSRIAAVAQLVLSMAPTDSTAMQILSKQISNLLDTVLGPLVDARCAGAVPCSEPGLILSGGVLTQGIYQRLLLERVSKKGMQFAYIETVEDPGVVGAEYLASWLQSNQN